ncbi:glycoside hydrolase family 24 protein [Inquilinus sp. OTU3971]|uniref:glycoside hydrolase family 24 protein n=1 Tax=Inquilinus sp. OTU3971 TaxID=3043855 RepID=UPI00313F0F50
MPRLSPIDLGSSNLAAFLDTLAYSEGTSTIAGSDDGYNVIVGGELLKSYLAHPRKLVWLPRYQIKSSAAGRYQFLARTWDDLAKRLRLPDFTPESQDLAAVELIRGRRALDVIKGGRIAEAIDRCRNIWASLPGAGYGQREHKLEALLGVYVRAGGALSDTTTL